MTTTANGQRTRQAFTPPFDMPPVETDTTNQYAEQLASEAAELLPPSEPFKSPITDKLRAQGSSGREQTTEPPAPHWADQLRQWWISTADCDISKSLDKIVEYGGSGAAYDLIATGRDLAAMNGRKHIDDSEAVELGILFYLSSKINRWMAAVIDGRRPSDDTLLDIVYYGMMARRNRAVGGWPIA